MLQKPIQSEETVEEAQENEEDENVFTHPEELEGYADEPMVHPEQLELEGDSEEQEPEEVASAADPMQAMRDEIAALRAQIAGGTAETPAEPIGSPTLEKISGISFVKDDEDVTDLTMSATGLNEFGERILNAAVQAAVTHAFSIAQAESSKAVASYAYSREFYDRYPELRGHGDLVESMSTAIEAEKPNVTPQELFLETAKRSYAKIGKKLPTPNGQARRAPGFTQATVATSVGQGGVKPKSVAQDVQDLLRHKGVLR